MGPRIAAAAVVVIALLGEVAVGLFANSFDVPKAWSARIALIVATILAGWLALRLGADRDDRQRSAFAAELDDLVTQAGRPPARTLVREVRNRIANPSPQLEQRIESTLNGLSQPDWPLAKAIVEACDAIAAVNHVGLSAGSTDLTAWQERHRRSLEPSLILGRPWTVGAVILAVVLLIASGLAPAANWLSGSSPTVPHPGAARTPARSTGTSAVVVDVDPRRWPAKPIHEINLVDGQTIDVVQTGGSWNCAQAESRFTDANGDPGHRSSESQEDSQNLLVPDKAICLLVGRIGNGPWFEVGSRRAITADRSGELQLT
ncbi:MAG: hypothetical protein QOE51_4958, partial [Actinoplanes sp.]|nr:hypothetical protein [Actinoplanes sp.]